MSFRSLGSNRDFYESSRGKHSSGKSKAPQHNTYDRYGTETPHASPADNRQMEMIVACLVEVVYRVLADR